MTSGPNDPNVPGSSDPYAGGSDPRSGGANPYAGGGDPNAGGAPQYGGPQHGESPYGSQPYGSQPYGEPQYGDPQYQAPQYGGQQPYPTGGYQAPGPSRPADLAIRFGARLLDGLIVGIPTGIVVGILSAIGWSMGSVGGWIFGVLSSIVWVVAIMGYFSWMEANRGQTFGKQICNLRTEGPNGGNPTMEQAFKRNAFYLISFGGMLIGSLLSIGFLSILGWIIQVLCGIAALAVMIVIAATISSSPTKQGKHDEFAGGTKVVVAP